MFRRFHRFLYYLVGGSALFGQVAIVGSGYSQPAGIRVTAGQITTFFVTGLKSVPAQPVVANILPLPKTLAGISVTVKQSRGRSYPAPLLRVEPACADLGKPAPAADLPPVPDCAVAAVTVQIPYEMPFIEDAAFIDTRVVIQENGNDSQAFRIYSVFIPYSTTFTS